MLQQPVVSDASEGTPPDSWSGWAKVVDLPASVGNEIDDDEADKEVADTVEDAGRPDAPVPAPEGDLAAAVSQLAAQVADERSRRTAVDEALHQAETRAHTAELEVARLATEVATERSRIVALERDRDEVIRRAEELLTAVRERADQRMAAELEATRRHWSELLSEERRRVEVLDNERAGLTKRLEDAWLAGAVLRRSRPLRLRPLAPGAAAVASAEEEALEILEEHETDSSLIAESPQLAEEIEGLRQRLRAQLHKPPNMPTVEDGVDRLREARVARDAESAGRRRNK